MKEQYFYDIENGAGTNPHGLDELTEARLNHFLKWDAQQHSNWVLDLEPSFFAEWDLSAECFQMALGVFSGTFRFCT